jgi:predicted nucleic-acid-binding Zn-ribbon protein
MSLDEDQYQKVSQWLDKKGVESCPACGNTTLVAQDMFSVVVVDAQGNRRIGGKHTQMVQVLCGNCWYTMLFAAEPIGLIQQ